MQNFIELYAELNEVDILLRERYITKETPKKHKSMFAESIHYWQEALLTIAALGDPYNKEVFYKHFKNINGLISKSKIEISIKFPNGVVDKSIRSQFEEIHQIVKRPFYENLQGHEPLYDIATTFITFITEFVDWFKKTFPVTTVNGSTEKELTIMEIAMLCAITGKQINPQNKDLIAKEFGKPKAGSLYQDYLKMSTPQKRISIDPEQQRIVKAQITRYESIMPLITDQIQHSQADNEYQKLLSLLD